MRGITKGEAALGVFVGVYLAFAVVAYTDFPRQATEDPLTDLEREGLEVWRRNNCQSCHQIYGFGGFLGPDLTNRLRDGYIDQGLYTILENGLGRMPALHLSVEDQDAVFAYLQAVNRTGQSQPTPLSARRKVPMRSHFGLLAERWEEETGERCGDPVERGVAAWGRLGCGACHVPFTIGDNLAPDLTASAVNRSEGAVRKILEKGRGRMPSTDCTSADLEYLCALLEWVADHRTELVEMNDRLLEREAFSWSALPWFEYR